MLMCWNAVVEKKVSKGVVIKNLLDGEETLFPFDIPKLAIVDSDKMIVDWHIGTPWVAATEKDKVIVGRRLIAFFQSVENKWVPYCAAFRGDFSFRNGDDVFVDPHQRHVVVIYHDFEKEVKKETRALLLQTPSMLT